MSSVSRSDVGTCSSGERLHGDSSSPRRDLSGSSAAISSSFREGECSDSDALLPTQKQQPLPSPDRPSSSNISDVHTHSKNSTARPQRSSSFGSAREIDIEMFMNEGEACSPLLQSTSRNHSPRITHAMNSKKARSDADGPIQSNNNNNGNHPTRDRASPSGSPSVILCQENHQILFNGEGEVRQQTLSTARENETTRVDQAHSVMDSSSRSDHHSVPVRQRKRSPSPLTLSPHGSVTSRHEYTTIANSITLRRDSSNTSSTTMRRSTSQLSSSSEEQDVLHSVTASAPTTSRATPPSTTTTTRSSSPSAASSAPSSHSNSSSRETGGLGSLRRLVRSRAVAPRNPIRATAELTSSSHLSTQSLGEEDLFALTINGEDPRLPIYNNNNNNSINQTTTSSIAHQQNGNNNNNSNNNQNSVSRLHSSENFPPVWEESSDSELEVMERGRRRRTLSEPSINRLRNFLFPRTISPGVRRRGSRQSSSVRRHLPQSSPPVSGASSMVVASPLSTTAAAALFTSSQTSVDSLHEHGRHPSRRRQQQQQHHQQQEQPPQPNPYIRHGGQQTRSTSTSTLEDSARVVGTLDRSIVADSEDSMSISTIGNSTMARSEIPAALSSENSIGQSSGTQNMRVLGQQYTREINREGGGTNNGGHDREGGDDTDPNREARVRWIRINQRFQLMITCVAILFSILLLSILISWIVLTSAYVVTFEKACDVPLKLFYWLVTLQLILDVFRNDIMRYILQWDPSAQTSTQHILIPARVVAYNIAYLAYAMLVLRMGVNCVYIDGRHPDSTCRSTSPELFQSSIVFVTLTLAGWFTVIFGYLIPFCFVAVLLTWNGYNPGESVTEATVASGPNSGGVFPGAYSRNGAPPGCIEQLREIELQEIGYNCPQECCICMEDFRSGDAIVETECHHILHKNCCSVWLRQARTCPVCRTDIPNAQQERLRQQQMADEPEPHQDLEQQRQAGQPPARRPTGPVNQRPRVHISSPHLPFRPAGRHEVETLIRAFRQPGPRVERRGSGRGRGGSERTQRQTGGSGSPRHSDRGMEPATAAGIEITNINYGSDSTVHETGVNQFVL